MFLKKTNLLIASALLVSLAPALEARRSDHDWDGTEIRHVLLISIDGMHAVDYINCKNGIPR